MGAEKIFGRGQINSDVFKTKIDGFLNICKRTIENCNISLSLIEISLEERKKEKCEGKSV